MYDEDSQFDEVEFRVMWDIGDKGAKTAFYIQKPTGVKKQVEKLRAKKARNVVIQSRPVGEFSSPYSDDDLQEVFGIKRGPRDWSWVKPEDVEGTVIHHCSKFPRWNAAEAPEADEFAGRVRAIILSGSGDLPGWS